MLRRASAEPPIAAPRGSVVRADRRALGQESRDVVPEADHAVVVGVTVARRTASVRVLAPRFVARRAFGPLGAGTTVALWTAFRAFPPRRAGFFARGCGRCGLRRRRLSGRRARFGAAAAAAAARRTLRPRRFGRRHDLGGGIEGLGGGMLAMHGHRARPTVAVAASAG